MNNPIHRTNKDSILTAAVLLFFLNLEVLASNVPAADDLFDMSLAQLMDVEIYVPASITEKNPLKTPASVTIITAEDIARTPARNLLDLIEIYVPGALYLNHSIGPVPGIRGVIADRPYKFLVNVNGINVNIKAHYGARLELLNWDLNDIERVEIVRGPGSVTYGPGAIGGVINITTKKAKNHSGAEFGGAFWDKYDSIGNYIGYGLDTEKFSLYSYLSIVDTAGHTPDLYGVENAGDYGYVGSPTGAYNPSPPFIYLADFQNEPQIKAMADFHFKDTWRFWARYVTSSSDLAQGSSIKYPFDGEYKNFRQARFRYFQLALENQTPITEDWSLKSLFGLSSIDVHDIQKWDTRIAVNDADNLQNIGWIWSEWEYFARFMLNYKPADEQLKAAVGFEYSYDQIRPAWGNGKNNGLKLSDGIISGPGSGGYGEEYRQVSPTHDADKYFPVGSGWDTHSYAFLGELNYQHTPKMQTIWSARVDKHSFTDYMFSPRFALIYQIRQEDYLKLIAQRSVRMNTQEELFISHEQGLTNKPEKLDTYEVIYSGRRGDHMTYQASAFFNKNKVIAWEGTLRRSALIGELQTFGLEFETRYQKDNFTIGANHSFVKQLDWELDDEVATSGISYSDYFYNTGSGIITSKGNDLANWSNHATKLFTNIDFLDGKLTLHGDMRALWGFEGYKDGLNALAEAGGTPVVIDDLHDHDVYDLEIIANVSLTYHINKSSDLSVFVQNIPVLGDNKRYSYSSGYKKIYPDKTAWVEEPTVVGFQYRFCF